MENAAAAGSPVGFYVDCVAELIRSNRYRYNRETELHVLIEQVLTAAGITVQREVRIGDAGRIDMVIPGRVGVEVKVTGQTAAVWRQLRRYAASGELDRLLLVTTCARHVAGLPLYLHGIPVHTVVLYGGLG
jgi:hypothetical protein